MKNIVDNPNAKPRPKEQQETVQYHFGRGAQINTKNKSEFNQKDRYGKEQRFYQSEPGFGWIERFAGLNV